MESLMLKLKLQSFGYLMQRAESLEKTLRLGKTEGKRWLDGTLTQWTGAWANSGRLWNTGKPGVRQSMGLQRVRHDWATQQQRSMSARLLCTGLHRPEFYCECRNVNVQFLRASYMPPGAPRTFPPRSYLRGCANTVSPGMFLSTCHFPVLSPKRLPFFLYRSRDFRLFLPCTLVIDIDALITPIWGYALRGHIITYLFLPKVLSSVEWWLPREIKSRLNFSPRPEVPLLYLKKGIEISLTQAGYVLPQVLPPRAPWENKPNH